jgi:hypothetical protein
MVSSAEKASGIPAAFQSSLEFSTANVGAVTTRVGRTLLCDSADCTLNPPQAPHLDSGASKNLHCPHPLPSGF